MRKDVVWSGLIFIITTLSGILSASIIISYFGFSSYGMLMLIRNLTPLGLLGLLDFALPDSVTRKVAVLNSKGDLSHYIGSVTTLYFAYQIIIAFLLMLLYFIFYDSFNISIGSFNVHSIDLDIVLASIIAFPIFASGIMADAILKGMNSYGLIRALDLVVSIGFLFIAYISESWKYGVELLAYGWLVLQIFRSVIVIIITQIRGKISIISSLSDLKETLIYARSLYLTKVSGFTVAHLPVLLLGWLFTLEAAGRYELIARLSRAAKSGIGVVSIPFITHGVNAMERYSRKNVGIRIFDLSTVVFTIMLPFISGFYFISNDVVVLLTGSSDVQMNQMISASLLWPLLTCLYQISYSVGSTSKEIVSTGARFNIVGTILVLFFGMAFSIFFGADYFVLGFVVSEMILIVPRYRFISKFFHINSTPFIKIFSLLLIVSLVFFYIVMTGVYVSEISRYIVFLMYMVVLVFISSKILRIYRGRNLIEMIKGLLGV